jgi:DeoR family transcriptional regulator, fructose operon transcriptional repressor
MLPEDRRSRIQDLLSQKSSVTISELAELFGTSEMTVRRDLDELEARGVCQRIHGGATSLRVQEYRPPPYPSYPQREQCQVREKIAIGQAAAALVRPGDVIAVDSGTTAAYLAQALRTVYPLTVITNSIRVLDQLHDIIQIALISPGGTLLLEERTVPSGDLAFVGPIAVQTLRSFRPSKAFISTAGITVADGISNAGLYQAEIKRTLIEIADEAILITDYSKFGRVAGFLVAPATAFTRVITDTAAPEPDVASLRALGIEVIRVEPALEAVPLRPSLITVAADHSPVDPCNGSQN